MLNTEPQTFDDFYLSDEMRRALHSVEYTQPTPVQGKAIPLILAGIDLTLQSPTGSGKTAAFAIPIIEMLEPRPGRIDVLVMTPTRELAKQVCKEFEGLGQFKDLKATAIYGGTSYERQYEALETASIVVATPGRLLDLCEKKRLDLSQLRVLVLDEADEMLSMGFRDDIEAVMAYLPEERQSILCSATITNEIKALANSILFYPEFVTLSSDSVAALDVTHYYYSVTGVGRPRDLLKVLEYEEPDSALIFANTKRETFSVTTFLKRHGYRADVLNGDLPQKEREKTLRALRDGKIDYIVATDVAARGIDISDLSHVLNYSLPDSAEVYIHRTGRTGRAGKKGKAISLIAPTEVDTFFQIKKMYDVKLEERALPTTREIMTARQQRSLIKLNEDLDSLEGIPYGAHLKVAEQLLMGAPEIDEHINRATLAARLLALADSVVSGEFQRPANGRGPATVAQKAAPAERKAPQKEEPVEKREEAIKTEEVVVEKEEKKERAPAKASARSRKSRDDRDRRKSTSDDEERSSRRRRRRRGRTSDSDNGGARAATSPEPSSPDIKGQDEDMDQITPVAPAIDSPSSTRKMYMNIGRNAFESAKELIDMVCYMSGMDPEDFGKVNVESSYSFVHVREDYFSDVIAALHGQEWEGNKITAEPARK